MGVENPIENSGRGRGVWWRGGGRVDVNQELKLLWKCKNKKVGGIRSGWYWWVRVL